MKNLKKIVKRDVTNNRPVLIKKFNKNGLVTSVKSYQKNIVSERWVCEREKFKYDKNNNLIYHKDQNGVITKYEYDIYNNLVHEVEYAYHRGIFRLCKTEKWYEYTKNGKIKHEKHSSGYDKWNDYDDRDNLIHRLTFYKSSIVLIEDWWEYDENNNEIHYKSSIEDERWKNYDDAGRIIYEKYNDRLRLIEGERWIEYDITGSKTHVREISSKEFDDYEEWWDYNNENKVTRYSNSRGRKEIFIYVPDESVITISYLFDNETYKSCEAFDEQGNVTLFIDSNGHNYRYYYTYY